MRFTCKLKKSNAYLTLKRLSKLLSLMLLVTLIKSYEVYLFLKKESPLNLDTEHLMLLVQVLELFE